MSTNYRIYLLVAIFGSSSWLATNAVWMELPLLTQELPEKWQLPSFLAAAVQIGCIGPLVYSIIHKCTNLSLPPAPAIQALLIFCTISMFAMAFSWQATVVFGESHAVALIVLMLFVALVNSTSNVLFMPYMITFHPVYLTAYFVGMGLSSLIPSIVSLAQGTSRYECVSSNVTGAVTKVDIPARFEVREFFLVMSAWMCLTAATFPFLHWFRHLVDKDGTTDSDVTPPLDESSPLNGSKTTSVEKQSQEDSESQEQPHTSSLLRYSVLLACLSFVSAQMNAAIPSVQSFATLPYSQLTYHLALAIGNIASPIACFLPMWIQPRSMPVLVGLTGFTTVVCGAIIALALQSPYPVLHESVWGAVISIAVSVCASGMNSYLRTVLTSVIREDSPSESRLFWCGVFTQIGAFVGSCIMFPLVNFTNFFKYPTQCG